MIMDRRALDQPGLGIGNDYIDSRIRRHSRYDLGDLICMKLAQQPQRLYADLYHPRSVIVPANRVHHKLGFRGIRSNILTHRKLFILQHRFKICHLFTGIKTVTVVFRNGSRIYCPGSIKQMDLIDHDQFGDLAQLFFRK